MFIFPPRVENELMDGAIHWSFMKLEGVTIEEVKDIQKQLDDKNISWWHPYVLENGNENLFDVFLLPCPGFELGGVENWIVNGRISFRQQYYRESITAAERYLVKKCKPDIQVYGMLGMAYLNYAGQLANNVYKPEKRTPAQDQDINDNREIGIDYLRLYSYFRGSENPNELDTDQIRSEVSTWLDSHTPKEKTQKGEIRFLDVKLVSIFNKKAIRMLKDKKDPIRAKNLTIEEVGKRLKRSPEVIDLVKIEYARMAVRAQFPHIAEQYIESVKRSPNRTELVNAKLSQFKKELLDPKKAINAARNNIQARNMLWPKDSQGYRLLFIKPDKRNHRAS